MAPTTRNGAMTTNNPTKQSLADLFLAKLKNFSAWSSENRKNILKSLHVWLVSLQLSHDSEAASHLLSSGYLHSLNCSLFQELQRRLLVTIDDASVGQTLGQEKVEVDSHSSTEELLLLLRCFMVTLSGLESDQKLLLDKSQYLLEMLHTMIASSKQKKLCELEIGAISYAGDFFLKPCPSLIRSMLEVFIDELLLQTNLRQTVLISDLCLPTRDSVIPCIETDFGCVVEAVFAHFLISVSLWHGFEDYFRSVAWVFKSNCPAPEISLSSAVTLLLNPVITSAPPLLLAHVMLVVSEVITANLPSDNSDHNSSYFHSFERAISMYHIHLSRLEIVSTSVDVGNLNAKQCAPVRNHPSSFWSQFECASKERIFSMLQDIESSLGSSHCSCSSSGTRVSSLTEHAMENLWVIEEPCRDVAFSFLSGLITEVSDKAYASDRKENICMQELYVLASLLKLISSSLLQAVRCLRNSSYLKHSESETSVGSHLSEEHGFLVSIISSFKAYKICRPFQQLLLDYLDAEFKYDGSKLMLAHLSGLLSYCVAEGLEVVAKGCLSLIMALLNFLFFEEGTLDFLNKPVLPMLNSCSTESTSNGYAGLESLGEIQSSSSIRKSSIEMASHFKRIHDLQLRKFSSREEGSEDEPTIEVAEVLEPELLHNTRTKGGRRIRNHFDWGKLDDSFKDEDNDVDMDDFLACQPGFSGWLVSRAKFRKWKSKKRGKRFREKMKASCRESRSREKL